MFREFWWGKIKRKKERKRERKKERKKETAWKTQIQMGRVKMFLKYRMGRLELD
jgi:hypothetical protein